MATKTIPIAVFGIVESLSAHSRIAHPTIIKYANSWDTGHEPNVNEEPKGVFQSRAYLIMYGLLVTAGLVLFSQTGRARIARLHC
jgi:hypothetical protein